jgi:hypothetical protein
LSRLEQIKQRRRLQTGKAIIQEWQARVRMGGQKVLFF